MLVQTDKFGTSVAQSLRVHSETLRTKRRQRAEEAAAKTGVKMVFPLVFCIFPAIWVVTIGPAAIKFIEVLVADGATNDGMTRHRCRADRTSSDDARRRRRRRRSRRHGPAGRSRSSSCSSRRCTPAKRPARRSPTALRLPYAILEPLIERARARAAGRSARRHAAPAAPATATR